MDNKEYANEKIETTEDSELEKVTGGYGEYRDVEPTESYYKAWGSLAAQRRQYEIEQRHRRFIAEMTETPPSRQLPDAIKQRDEQHLRMEELYGSGN